MGSPAVQTMSLTFVETVLLDKKRYIESVSSFTGGNLTRIFTQVLMLMTIKILNKIPRTIDNINGGADSSNPISESD